MRTQFTALLALAAASLVGSAHAAGISGQGDWETTLQPRDLDGNAVNGPEAFYDTALGITWLRNVNVNPSALVDWNVANTLVNALVVGGVDGWRLPTMVDTAAPGCQLSYAGGTDCGYNVQTATSEMAHLFHVTLGNKAYCDPSTSTASTCVVQLGWGMTNPGDFQNANSDSGYWSGLEFAPSTREAWSFNLWGGFQDHHIKTSSMRFMAVHPGDVAAVPEPQSLALMLAGLLGVAWRCRARR